MNKQMVGRVQHKHDTEANWLKATNFIPLDGELIIYDADEENLAPRFKVGDGETVVSALPFSKSEADVDQDSLSFAYFEEDGTEYLPEALPIDADSLGGYPASSYSTTEQIEAQYVKASIEEVAMGEVAMTKADIADKATEADRAIEADNSLKLENKTINELFSVLFEVEHPVGSLYLSSSDTDNPNSKWSVFGITCTWELVPDVFLLGAGGSYALGDTGGEAEHTLTVDEMPPAPLTWDNGVGEKVYYCRDGIVQASLTSGLSGSVTFAHATDSVRTKGGSQPHNNMPPYLTTNIWKRIS